MVHKCHEGYISLGDDSSAEHAPLDCSNDPASRVQLCARWQCEDRYMYGRVLRGTDRADRITIHIEL